MAGARGCLGELPGSRVVDELVTNMERTLLAESSVALALWIRLTLSIVERQQYDGNIVNNKVTTQVKS